MVFPHPLFQTSKRAFIIFIYSFIVKWKWVGVSVRLQKRSLTSCYIFPPTAETHDIAYGDYITDGLLYFPLEYKSYRQYIESAAHCCLCSGQSSGTFPPEQSNTCMAQHSRITHRVAYMCCWGHARSPLHRGSPSCCVMRKAWGPACVSDRVLYLWGDPRTPHETKPALTCETGGCLKWSRWKQNKKFFYWLIFFFITVLIWLWRSVDCS